MLTTLLRVSRPRFWMYLVGPYLIGIGASQEFNNAVAVNSSIWWWLLFFSFPANLFIYGVNDIADTDTDQFNEKKGTYEAKIAQKDIKKISWSIILFMLPFVPLVWDSSIQEQILFLIFIISGAFYSLPPIRMKAIPFIDSLSNGVLYTMAGLMGYYAAGGTDISWVPYLAGAVWAAVMHAYSAIPDISADTRAGVRTIATVLKEYNTLIICLASYLVIAALLMWSGYPFHALLTIPYFILIVVSIRRLAGTSNVFSIYKVYPYVTYVVGALVYAFNIYFS